MDHIVFNLEILTPAFISGADQGLVELRSATIKGLLQWWWRALQDPQTAIEDLKIREGRLFGSAEMKIRSSIRISVSAEKFDIRAKGSDSFKSGVKLENAGKSSGMDPLKYLGFGPVGFNNQLTRSAVMPRSTFSVQLSWRKGVLDESQVHECVRAMASLVTLGGIGARSRKGFGALCGDIQEVHTAYSIDHIRHVWDSQLESLKRNGDDLNVPQEVPRWTNLKYRKVRLLEARADAISSMADLGQAYKNIRPSAKNMAKGWVGGSANPRRASALFLSVIKQEDGFHGFMALLPACKDGAGRGADEMLRFAEEFAKGGSDD